MRKFHHDIPGPLAIILQILSGAACGVLIAGIYLAFKPVKMVDASTAAAAKETPGERNVVTYIPGNPGHPSGQQWRVRERAFVEKAPTGVAIIEQDVNRWVATTYGSSDRRVKFDEYDLEIDPGLPLFRINGSDFQIGLEYRVTWGEADKSVVTQARGRFEKSGDRHVFVPTKVYVGSCPLPGPLGKMFVGKFVGAYPVPDNVEASWKAVTSVKVEENQLKLAFN